MYFGIMYLTVLIVLLRLCSLNVSAERKASLVVLPPLILGHEELYDDVKDESDVSNVKGPENEPNKPIQNNATDS